MTKLYVSLTDDEFVKLAQMANQECRHPRDQAQIIIRSVLFGKSPPKRSRQGAIKSTSVRTTNQNAGASR